MKSNFGFPDVRISKFKASKIWIRFQSDSGNLHLLKLYYEINRKKIQDPNLIDTQGY